MKPFLLIQSRPESDAAESEYIGFLQATRLPKYKLQRINASQKSVAHIDLRDFSGLLLGGSPYNISETVMLKSDTQIRVESELIGLLKNAEAVGLPVFGVCYGFGIATIGGNGEVARTHPESLGVTEILPTLSGSRDPILNGVNYKFEAIVGHTESCRKLPNGATVLATSRNCPIQLIKTNKNHYFSQFHPEVDAKGLAIKISTYSGHGYFRASDVDHILRQGLRADLNNSARILENFVRLYQVN